MGNGGGEVEGLWTDIENVTHLVRLPKHDRWCNLKPHNRAAGCLPDPPDVAKTCEIPVKPALRRSGAFFERRAVNHLRGNNGGWFK